MCVRRLMEFLGNVAPSVNVTEKPQTKDGKVIAPDPTGPVSIYVFKTGIEPHIGEVSYFKVMSGKVKEGDDLVNIDRGSKERLSQIFAVAGQIRTKVDELVAGDIGATVKLKDTRTGNTLNVKVVSTILKKLNIPNRNIGGLLKLFRNRMKKN